jgi:hypothetical protein
MATKEKTKKGVGNISKAVERASNSSMNSMKPAREEVHGRAGKYTGRLFIDMASAALGGLIGTFIPYSGWGGLGLVTLGHWTGISALSFGGTGMIFGAATTTQRSVSTGFWDEAKQKMKTYGGGLKQKFSIPFVGKSAKTDALEPTTTTEATNGMGEVKYLNHALDPFDLSEMDRFEKQIHQSAESYSQMENSVNGHEQMHMEDKLY